MTPEIAKLSQHAHELAKAFGVLLVLDDSMEPEFAVACNGQDLLKDAPPEIKKLFALLHLEHLKDFVMAKTITDETSYAVVLHELGHHLAPWGMLRKHRNVPTTDEERVVWHGLKLEEEHAAWDWARHYALYWSVAMQQVEQHCYGSYINMTYDEIVKRDRHGPF